MFNGFKSYNYLFSLINKEGLLRFLYAKVRPLSKQISNLDNWRLKFICGHFQLKMWVGTSYLPSNKFINFTSHRDEVIINIVIFKKNHY